MSKKSDSGVSREDLKKQLKILKNALRTQETQRKQHEASMTAFNKANPDFIGYGIAGWSDINEDIRRLKSQIKAIQTKLKATH